MIATAIAVAIGIANVHSTKPNPSPEKPKPIAKGGRGGWGAGAGRETVEDRRRQANAAADALNESVQYHVKTIDESIAKLNYHIAKLKADDVAADDSRMVNSLANLGHLKRLRDIYSGIRAIKIGEPNKTP